MIDFCVFGSKSKRLNLHLFSNFDQKTFEAPEQKKFFIVFPSEKLYNEEQHLKFLATVFILLP